MSRRDRDNEGRARNARPRDGLGRPLPYGSDGVERQPEGIERTPAQTLAEAQELLDDGKPFHAHEVFEDAWPVAPGKLTLPCRVIVRVVPPPCRAAATGAITAITAKQPIRAEMRDVRRMLFLRRLVTSEGRLLAGRSRSQWDVGPRTVAPIDRNGHPGAMQTQVVAI